MIIYLKRRGKYKSAAGECNEKYSEIYVLVIKKPATAGL